MMPQHQRIRLFRKPTQRQIALLRKAGVVPPQTKSDCRDTIFFLWRTSSPYSIHANGATERIERLRFVQQAWTGSAVRHCYDGRTGRVIAVSTYGPWTLEVEPANSFAEAHPFLARVRWRGQPASLLSINLLERAENVKALS